MLRDTPLRMRLDQTPYRFRTVLADHTQTEPLKPTLRSRLSDEQIDRAVPRIDLDLIVERPYSTLPSLENLHELIGADPQTPRDVQPTILCHRRDRNPIDNLSIIDPVRTGADIRQSEHLITRHHADPLKKCLARSTRGLPNPVRCTDRPSTNAGRRPKPDHSTDGCETP